MMKVKFSTYLEVDLGGMSTEELLNLRDEINAHVNGRINPRNVTLNVVLKSDNNCHTRIGYAIEKIIGKPLQQIKLSEIPEKVKLEQIENFRNLGRKSITTLNTILVSNGVSAIHN